MADKNYFTHPDYPGEVILTCNQCGTGILYPAEESHRLAIAGEKVAGPGSRLVCIPPDEEDFFSVPRHKLEGKIVMTDQDVKHIVWSNFEGAHVNRDSVRDGFSSHEDCPQWLHDRLDEICDDAELHYKEFMAKRLKVRPSPPA